MEIDLPELIPLDLPDQVAAAGQSGHVLGHNKIRKALDDLNKGKADGTEIAALQRAIDDLAKKIPAPAVWKRWTPKLLGDGWDLGNGVSDGWYKVSGEECTLHAILTMGTTTKFGDGQLYMTLPVSPAKVLPDGIVNGASSNSTFVVKEEPTPLLVNLAVYDTDRMKVQMIGPSKSGHMGLAAVTGTDPFTWQTGDIWRVPEFNYLVTAGNFEGWKAE